MCVWCVCKLQKKLIKKCTPIIPILDCKIKIGYLTLNTYRLI